MPCWLPWGMFGGLLFWGMLLFGGMPDGTAFAQQPPPRMPGDDLEAAPLRPAEMPATALYESRLLARALRLTPEQARRMQEIRRQEGPAMQSARRQVMAYRRRLNDAIYGEETSEALVEQRARELAAAETELTQLRARLQYRIRAVLTPEQVRVFNELRADPRGTLERRGPERPAPARPAPPSMP